MPTVTITGRNMKRPVAHVHVIGNRLIVRVDDTDNAAFWMEVSIPRDVILNQLEALDIISVSDQ